MCVHCRFEDFKTKVKQTIVLVGMVLTFKAFCYVMDWCLCCRLVPSLGILYLTHIPYFVLVRIWVRFDPRPNLMTWAGPSLSDPDPGMSQISSSSGNLTQKSHPTLMRCATFEEFWRWTKFVSLRSSSWFNGSQGVID